MCSWSQIIKIALYPAGIIPVITCICLSVTAQEDVLPPGQESTSSLKNAEAKLLEEMHYSFDDFKRIYDSLPRDQNNKVDWERATADGLINPQASIDENPDEEKIFDLRVVIKFNDMLVKNVVFSHAVHTFWLDCKSCHPKLFIPQVDANKMTMTEIREGKYCGKCHGMVAFPTNPYSLAVTNFRSVCKRCHRERR